MRDEEKEENKEEKGYEDNCGDEKRIFSKHQKQKLHFLGPVGSGVGEANKTICCNQKTFFT